MYDTYQGTPTLKSKPKTQRAIIADILLNAVEPLSFDKIVAEANGGRAGLDTPPYR